MKKKMGLIFYLMGVFLVLTWFINPLSSIYREVVTASSISDRKISKDKGDDVDYIDADGEALEDNQEKKKIAYLTFDDGPSKNTYRILDILKKYNIKATFFVNGKPVFKDTYIRMYKEGHSIGNHTYCHEYNEIYSSVEDFKSDTNKLNRLLIEYGIKPTYMLRFPGGSNNTVSKRYGGDVIMDELVQVMSEEGYKYYDWNVTSGDASRQCLTKDEIVQNVINGCKGKSNAIILFHDLNPKVSTVEALPEVIEYLLSENYEFRVLNSGEESIVHFK
ncbi:MAG: polysaccharide deacetylase family protein [Clostridium perfringens]|nr:polysaccharide deacetylase family protein [Clostridium perfringens]